MSVETVSGSNIMDGILWPEKLGNQKWIKNSVCGKTLFNPNTIRLLYTYFDNLESGELNYIHQITLKQQICPEVRFICRSQKDRSTTG